MPRAIKTIVSHEFPDLDSILSIYLLRKYGNQKYPGVENAKLEFYPAGVLPGGKTPEELEGDGILAVDTGGGRLDTHSVENEVDDSKIDKCASTLIAEDLDLDRLSELEQILTFSRLQDVEGRSIQSKDVVDHAFSLPNIIAGFNLIAERYERTVRDVGRLLDAIIAAEKERRGSLSADKISMNRYQRIKIIVSKRANSAVIRLIRWQDKAETHPEFLDMDSALSIYLLRKYGMRKYPELSNALLKCYSAGVSEDVIDKFEKDKILMVDTEYTESDSPAKEADVSTEANEGDNSQHRKSASALIIEELSLDTVTELAQFLAFSGQLDAKVQAIEKTDPVDRVVSIFNMLYGFNLLNGPNFEQTVRDMEQILDVIIAREKDWCDAVAQYEANAKVYKTGKKGKVKIVAVEAESGATIKVSRWKDKADLTIHRNLTQGHVGIVVRTNGPLHNFRLAPLAKTLRTAEAIEGKERVDFSKLSNVGEVHGWFLHSSDRILSKGSPKATNVAPTRIPFEVLTDLVLSHFDKDLKLPDKYCPINRCIGKRCLFFHLKLRNCYVHRERLEFKKSPLGGRLSQDVLEQLRILKHSTNRHS